MIRAALTVPAVCLLGLTACSSTTDGTQSSPAASTATTTVTVTSSDGKCDLSSTTAPAGKVTFEVSNKGADVTEFYLYQQDGTTVAGEVEDVTPGLTRELSVDTTPGTYIAACKPTSDSEGIRLEFTVS